MNCDLYTSSFFGAGMYVCVSVSHTHREDIGERGTGCFGFVPFLYRFHINNSF